VENRVPASPYTVMRVASISKALTATALGKLMEAGKVDLDRPVAEYVDEWRPAAEKDPRKAVITMR